MELVTTIANAIATYILPEAFKEEGKAIGKGVSQAVSQLITVIREKFKAAGREGTLADFEEEQTEENQSEFETVLKKLMSKDNAFTNNLAQLVKQIESSGVVRNIGIADTTAQESVKVVKIAQKVNRKAEFIEQIGATNIKAPRIEIGEINEKA